MDEEDQKRVDRIKEMDELNRVARDFFKTFLKEDPKLDDPFRWEGFDLIERVVRWAAQYPDDVKIANVDDSLHTSSILVFILHRARGKIWGTSVQFIPQNGHNNGDFFLYPRAAKQMAEILEEINKIPGRGLG